MEIKNLPMCRLIGFARLVISHFGFAQVTLNYPRDVRGIEFSISKIKNALTELGYRITQGPSATKNSHAFNAPEPH